MNDECSAAKRRRERRNQSPCKENTLLTGHHPNIGGVIVAPAGQASSYRDSTNKLLEESALASSDPISAFPRAGQASLHRDSDKPQILQKSALASSGSISGPALTFPPAGQASLHRDSDKPQILQKSALASSGPISGPALTFPPDIEYKDQSVGLRTFDASTAGRYQQFNSQAVGSVIMSQTSRPEGTSGHKMKVSQSGLLYTLQMIREPVVDYQETRGIPRNEEITFLTLVTSLCTQAYTAAITILVMLWNLMPLVDGLVYFVRFVLDKIIDIVQTDDNKERAVKAAILFGELTITTFIIFMIVGLIFMPVYVLMARLFSKIFSMIAW